MAETDIELKVNDTALEDNLRKLIAGLLVQHGHYGHGQSSEDAFELSRSLTAENESPADLYTQHVIER